MKISQKTLDRHAKSVLMSAAKYFSEQMESFKDDPETIKTIKKDTKDLVFIADYIKQGDLDRARECFKNLDTLIRDQIKNTTYLWLVK